MIKSTSIGNYFGYITIKMIIECDVKGIFSDFYRSPYSNLNLSINRIIKNIETNINVNRLNLIAGDIKTGGHSS